MNNQLFSQNNSPNLILVTGGAGFIGSHVNKLLHRAQFQTIVLDNLSQGYEASVRQGIFIKGELADRALLDQIFTQYPIKAVVHFASSIDVGESVLNPAKYYANNVNCTLNLLSSMIDHDVKTLLFSSSAAIFGLPVHAFIRETDPCSPINPYGRTKWMIEQMLHDFEIAYGLRHCCLRYFNAAGGDPDGEIKNYQTRTPNLIPRILLSIKKSNPSITIYGNDYPTHDGSCIRDYIHIEDLGRAHLLALKNLLTSAPSNAYNLGNGRGFSVLEVIQAVEDVLKIKIDRRIGEKRPGDPPSLLADSSKAKQELGWHPGCSLEQMIRDAWNSYLF